MCDQCNKEDINMMVEPTDVLHWIKMGRYFGYPSCCIESFIERMLDGSWNDTEKDDERYAGFNEGFLPCDDHIKQIKAGEIKIKDIIQNRICKTKYPFDHG